MMDPCSISSAAALLLLASYLVSHLLAVIHLKMFNLHMQAWYLLQ